MSTKRKKKLLSKDHKGKIGSSKRGITLTEEHKARISESLKGHECSEETKKKIGDGNRGKKYSAETRAKMSESFKGRVHTKETRAKMSESMTKKAAWSQEMLDQLVYMRDVKEMPFYKIGPLLPEPKSGNACSYQYKRYKGE